MQLISFIAGLFLFQTVRGTKSEIADKREEYDVKLSNFLKNVLEDLRGDMSEGIPDFGVPPLDPLNLPDTDTITIREGDKIFDAVNLKLKMENLSIVGISKYRMEDLKLNVIKSFVNFSLFVPELTGNGHYDLEGKIMEFFELRNDGPFTLRVKEVHIEGYGLLNISANSGQVRVRLEDLRLNLTYGSTDVEFPNLLGNDTVSKLLLEVTTHLGKRLFHHFHEEAMEVMNNSLLAIINKELDQRTLSQLLLGFL